jgi:tetratricopeptide (TPR) repeat protein
MLARGLGLEGTERAAFEAAAVGYAPAGEFPAGGVAVPRTLPRDVTSFTGREHEIAQLTGSVASATAGILAISGMAGIGKTALAVHVAHILAMRFPDGQLFLPLHGHTPGQQPMDPADALASLLLTTGVAATEIPPGLEPRAGLWRDRLAGKRFLLVLDDAASSAQVQPLLPGTAGSLVLVTSRRLLASLEDAYQTRLDTLPTLDAAVLLVRLAGRPGLEPHDPAVGQITTLCGYLPLAIALLARQLHHHPSWTPAALAAELTAAQDRLELMVSERSSVGAAFDLSYRDLPKAEQQLFRRLGLHPGVDIDLYAAAALGGIGLNTARRYLSALYDQYFLTEPTYGRYRLHDLIREHARILVSADPAADRDQALRQLLDYYQYTAGIAAARLAPLHSGQPAAPATMLVKVPHLPDRASALSWARAERADLLACLDYATRTGQDTRVVALTAAVGVLLRHDGPWPEAVIRYATAARAARALGDRQAESGALTDLGVIYRLTGDYPGAAQALEQALEIYRDLGDRGGEATALANLGDLYSQTGDISGAAQVLEQALEIYRDLGDRFGQANALSSLGAAGLLRGDYPSAAQALEQALEIYRDLGDRGGEATALANLGDLYSQTGDISGAAQVLQEALEIYHDLGDRFGQAGALTYLGFIYRLTGDYPGAARSLQEALAIHRDLGDRFGQANALGGLGAVSRLTGDYQSASHNLEQALAIYRDLSARGGEATALNELGALNQILGNLSKADACYQQALDLSRAIGSSWDQAHALAGLGRSALAAGRGLDAQALLRQALEIFLRIGAAEADGVADELQVLA